MSAFAESYKLKKSTVDKRSLRAHRRSIDWKKQREDTFSKGRELNGLSDNDHDLSKVEESDERRQSAQTNRTNTTRANTTTQQGVEKQSRRDMLDKWRAERDLKRKLAAEAKKPAFKVAHIEQKDIYQISAQRHTKVKGPADRVGPLTRSRAGAPAPSFSAGPQSTKRTAAPQKVPPPKTQTTTKSAKPDPKPQPPSTTRVATRSSSRTVPPPKTKPPPQPSVRQTRQTTSATKQTQPTKQAPKSAPTKKPLSKRQAPPTTRSSANGKSSSIEQTPPIDETPTEQSSTEHPPPIKAITANDSETDNTDIFQPPESIPSDTTKNPSQKTKASKGWINCERGGNLEVPPSFAPHDYTFDFTSSDKMKSYVFTPISPASTASFLGQNNQWTGFTNRTSSTPKNKATVDPVNITRPFVTDSSSSNSDMDSPRARRVTRSQKSRQSTMVTDEPKTEPTQVEPAIAEPSHVEPAQVKLDIVEPTKVETTCNEAHNSKDETTTDVPMDAEPEKMEINAENKGSISEASTPAVFVTPGPRRSVRRARSQSVNRDRVRSQSMSRAGSARKKTPRPNRSSLALRHLSPQDSVAVLNNSPMVEMKRRTPKQNSVLDSSLIDDTEDSDLIASFASNASKNESAPSDKLPQPDFSEESNPAKPTDQPTPMSPSVGSSAGGGEHDVKYFRGLLTSESDRLTSLADKWNEINENTADISEEVRGQIRTTVGQAHLLRDQRLHQFRGLVDDCEFKRGEMETTCSDLQGFWDLVNIQVEDVDRKFAGLDKLRADNWTVVTAPKPGKKLVKKPPKAAAGKSKFAVKSKFREFRAKMKSQDTTETSDKTEEANVNTENATEAVAKTEKEVESPKKTDIGTESATKTDDAVECSAATDDPVESSVKTDNPVESPAKTGKGFGSAAKESLTPIRKTFGSAKKTPLRTKDDRTSKEVSPWFKAIYNRHLRRSMQASPLTGKGSTPRRPSRKLGRTSGEGGTPHTEHQDSFSKYLMGSTVPDDMQDTSPRDTLGLTPQLPESATSDISLPIPELDLSAQDPPPTVHTPNSALADLDINSLAQRRGVKHRGPSLLFTPEATPAKRARHMLPVAEDDLMSFSPA